MISQKKSSFFPKTLTNSNFVLFFAFFFIRVKRYVSKSRFQIDEKRKRALDEHLNFIVDKTEKYSSLLAESLADQAGGTSTPGGTTGGNVSLR